MAKKKSDAVAAPAAKGATKKATTKKSAPAAEKAGAKATKGAAAAAAPKAAAKKGPVKLNERQTELLGKVHKEGEAGYHAVKAEGRTLEALRERKLVKRGAKDKEKGTHPYSLSKAGEKFLGSSQGGSSS